MAFRLRQLIDCDVVIEYECASNCKEYEGTICNVGSDFVELITRTDPPLPDPGDDDCNCRNSNKQTFIIPIQKIASVDVKNCPKCNKRDCCCN
ncbi:hypothetical protein [Guptibacillus algicola]|uniref:hypothetical protein n=1 Tax=Guptibacillus algicola TaxID=225844 RepID=UPI001CD3E0BC|nr:hypothetical protein [Alkalihalobacillus algicola]MCA0986773.1 hypothetical protein [Alkalihalobacillus algicola]